MAEVEIPILLMEWGLAGGAHEADAGHALRVGDAQTRFLQFAFVSTVLTVGYSDVNGLWHQARDKSRSGY